MTQEEKLKRKIDKTQKKLHRTGYTDNPDGIVNWLVYFEVSRLSGKMNYLLGAIGVLVALLLAIMVRG